MQVAFSPAEIAAFVQPSQSRGATTETIRGISALKGAGPGDLAFLSNSKYRSEVAGSGASIILVPADFVGEPRANQLFLVVEHPSLALGRLCARLEQVLWPKPAPGVHSSAVVEPGAEVAPTATVGPLCVVESGARVGPGSHLQARVFVGRGARVGENCWLMPGSFVAAECTLRDRVRLQPGAIVGSDGFGYEFVQGHHEKLPQIGMAVIESDVEIGANSTVDRARFGATVVGEGTKIDNLVQVAHNVVIGRHCIICAQVGISGSTTLEDFVILGGQAGLVGHITVGRGSKVGAKSGVNESLPAGSFVRGVPCRPYMTEQRLEVLRHRLPEFFKRLQALERAAAPVGKG